MLIIGKATKENPENSQCWFTSWISTSGNALRVKSCTELTSAVIEVRPDKTRPVLIQNSMAETESEPTTKAPAGLTLEAFF